MKTDPLPEGGAQGAPRRFFAKAREFAASLAKRAEELRLASSMVPDYALHYFDAMCAKFNMLPEPAAGDAVALKAHADAKAALDTPRMAITWKKLLLIDLALTRSLGFHDLLLRIADLRARLAGIMPPMPEGLAVKLDTATATDQPRLLAEAEALVTRIWLTRMARDARDQYVGELRLSLLQWFIFIALVFILASMVVPPLVLVIFISGMFGALVSIVRRLQGALANAPVPDQAGDLSALAHDKRAAVLSLLCGGLFAVLLYVVFAAGFGELVGAELAPKFNTPTTNLPNGADFRHFVNNIGPENGKAYAKVIVWSFVAGFFEQFVPDVLDRLAKKK
jgi:hypothetical protein